MKHDDLICKLSKKKRSCTCSQYKNLAFRGTDCLFWPSCKVILTSKYGIPRVCMYNIWRWIVNYPRYDQTKLIKHVMRLVKWYFEWYFRITPKTPLLILIRMDTIFLQYFSKTLLSTRNRISTWCCTYADKDFIE